MSETIAEVAAAWDQTNRKTVNGALFNQIHEKLVFLDRTHYRQYMPTLGPTYPDYETRLADWLENLTDDSSRRLLFEFARHITFFSREDFNKLYESALRGPVMGCWLVEELDLDICTPDLNNVLTVRYTTTLGSVRSVIACRSPTSTTSITLAAPIFAQAGGHSPRSGIASVFGVLTGRGPGERTRKAVRDQRLGVSGEAGGASHSGFALTANR